MSRCWLLFSSLTVILAVSVLLGGCTTTVDRTGVVSNASTPVQMLTVKVGGFIDLDLPIPPPHRWWTVDSGYRPYLHAKVDRARGRIRLRARQPGKTEVVCVLRDANHEIRKVVVGVEVVPK